MRTCCVPFCLAAARLHDVPYTSLRWKQWLKLCPFLLKYTYDQLEYVKICRDHFIRDHIDYKKGGLKKDAIPLLNLRTYCHDSEEQKLYMECKMLKMKLKLVNLKYKHLKSKFDGMQAIEKHFQDIPYLTGKAKVDTQVGLAGVELKADRYNEEEKLLALKLHQISPDYYRYLQKIFKLPRSSTVL